MEQIINYEALVKSILETNEGGVSLIGKDKQFIAFNQKFVQGYTSITGKEPVVGKLVYDHIPDEIRIHREEAVNRALKGENLVFEGEYKIDGKNRYYSTSHKPVFQDNEVVGVISYTTDITEKREAEAQIKKSEEKYFALFEQASDAIMVTDFRGNFLDVNASFCKMFGYTKDELLKLKASDLIDAKELENRPMNFDKLSNGQQIFSNRSMVHKNGTIINVEANLKKFDEDKIMAIARDVTELGKAQRQIQISEAKFRSAFENSAIGMALVGIDGKCLEVNKEVCKMCGYSEQELLTLSFRNITHPEDINIGTESFKKVMAGEADSFKMEKRFIHKNGEEVWVSIITTLIKDNQGNPLYLVGMIENITGRKNAEMHREKMTGDLIRQNKDLEQFAYIVSHNLRAPVANIIGLSKLLNDERYNNDIQNQCRIELESSVKRLDNVIMDLSQILQVKRDITEKKEVVYFSDLVNDINSSIRNLIVKENVQIITDFDSVNKITTLKSYLYSIFYNLISNSIKYRHPDRQPIIRISSKVNDNKIILSFEDNGRGIDLAKHGDQVFGLYKRFHPEIEGKGMGLFVVKTQVETLGGIIDIKSMPDKGNEFIIEF